MCRYTETPLDPLPSPKPYNVFFKFLFISKSYNLPRETTSDRPNFYSVENFSSIKDKGEGVNYVILVLFVPKLSPFRTHLSLSFIFLSDGDTRDLRTPLSSDCLQFVIEFSLSDSWYTGLHNQAKVR